MVKQKFHERISGHRTCPARFISTQGIQRRDTNLVDERETDGPAGCRDNLSMRGKDEGDYLDRDEGTDLLLSLTTDGVVGIVATTSNWRSPS